jgi:large subunit ribosomal protein L25
LCRVRVDMTFRGLAWNFFGCLDEQRSSILLRTTSALVDNLTMAAVAQKNIQLALALPARLRTFFSRYPPASILPEGADPETSKTPYQQVAPNPFQSTKHPVTGKWHEPKYSLRRQAELVKLARKHHVEELLPFTVKGTEERLRKRVELGLRVKGTGVGQKVKGHKHERQLVAKYVYAGIGTPGVPHSLGRLLTAPQEWRKGGRPCWRCRISSGSGRR